MPTLVVEGAPLGEAAALCMILAERHPQAGFALAVGHAQRAAYISWLFFLSNTLQTAYHNWFYPDQPAGQAAVESVKVSARRRIEASLERVDRAARQDQRLPAGRPGVGGGFRDDDAHALVAQHAEAGDRVAGDRRLREAHEGAALVQDALRARGPHRVGLAFQSSGDPAT